MNDRFERLLKSRIGLDASSVGSAVIERAVRQRMSGLALHDEDEYWMRLNGSPGEVQALIEAVVVPETWFFRYPESFTTLARLAFERLPSLGGGRALRILSLPCSTGEEPYSIVMALLDAGLSEYLFEVDALDVSARVIERASLGVYGRNSFRGDELGFRDRHFSEVADGYQLAEQVRRKVRFRCGNLLDPGLLAGEAPYDFVFCRNLLIYFDRPTQSEVVEVLKRLLRPDGAMFIGPAEASLLSQHGMQPIGVPLSFVFRRTSEAPRGARPKAVSDGARPVVAAAAERASVRPSPPPTPVQPGSASQRPAPRQSRRRVRRNRPPGGCRPAPRGARRLRAPTGRAWAVGHGLLLARAAQRCRRAGAGSPGFLPQGPVPGAAARRGAGAPGGAARRSRRPCRRPAPAATCGPWSEQRWLRRA